MGDSWVLSGISVLTVKGSAAEGDGHTSPSSSHPSLQPLWS